MGDGAGGQLLVGPHLLRLFRTPVLCYSTVINWKRGKNLTVKRVKKKTKSGTRREVYLGGYGLQL